MAWKRISTTTAATERPVDPADLRDQLTLEIGADDSFLMSLIDAATDHAEKITHRRFLSQQIRMVLPKFPVGAIILPFGKALSVEGITYIDSVSSTVELSGPSDSPVGTGWQEDLNDDEGGILLPNIGETWPGVQTDHISPVVINWTAGYGDDKDDVPPLLAHAIMMQAAKWYEARWDGEAPLEVEEMFKHAISPFKIIRYGD